MASRIGLDNQGRLILRENGKIILPFEHFANAVMLKHMNGPHGLHLGLEATLRAVSWTSSFVWQPLLSQRTIARDSQCCNLMIDFYVPCDTMGVTKSHFRLWSRILWDVRISAWKRNLSSRWWATVRMRLAVTTNPSWTFTLRRSSRRISRRLTCKKHQVGYGCILIPKMRKSVTSNKSFRWNFVKILRWQDGELEEDGPRIIKNYIISKLGQKTQKNCFFFNAA